MTTVLAVLVLAALFALPPGGFFTLAFLLLAIAWMKRARMARAPARERSAAIAARRAA